MRTIEDFEKHCASRGVTLTPMQRAFAETMLMTDETRKFLMGGMSSGRTLTMALLESFFDLVPRDTP